MEHKTDKIPVARRRTDQSPQVYVVQAVKSAVQNKIIEMERQSQIQNFHSTQTRICHKERSAVQNKKTKGTIETALGFFGQRKNLMNRPGKSHPKSESFYLTQILVCHEERSGMQNKITDGGPMKNESQ